MLNSRKAQWAGAFASLLSLSVLASAMYSGSVSAQERTYKCARRYPNRVCVGQMIRLAGRTSAARVTQITDNYLVLDGRAWITIWDLGQNGVAVGPPQDSYLQTCDSVRGEGMTMYARCRRMNGQWINTSINFYNCSSDGIWNQDGRLTCNRE
jgi:hypothetical protein